MNRHVTFALLIFVLCVLVLTASGCRTRDYSGTWKGTTSQGKPISFTVKDGAIIKAAMEYKLDCKRGGFCPIEGSLEGDVTAPNTIKGDEFTFQLAGGAEVKGKFTSGTDSNGELKLESKAQACDCSATATWNAKKQP